MVDRIVPATTEADRLAASGLTGLTDAGLVIAEPFRQWVIEDEFAAERPAWELIGAQITDDVTPYELMKLRLLNGSHSTLAYLGALRGHHTIADAVAEPALLGVATALIRTDMIPTLQQPEGVDLVAYGDQVLARYANPDLRHTTIQVAMDGSQKLPQRLLTPILAAVHAGAAPHAATLGVAAWMAFVALGLDTTGQALPLNDPLADRLGGEVRFIPTGGVGIDNLGEYLNLAAVHAVGGSWMVPAGLMRDGDWVTVTRLCREAVDLVRRIKDGQPPTAVPLPGSRSVPSIGLGGLSDTDPREHLRRTQDRLP